MRNPARDQRKLLRPRLPVGGHDTPPWASHCGSRPHLFFYGSTAQFGKESQTGFLPQFKVWKTKEYCMYFSFFKLKKWGKKT
ncbi:MAG: hypothetical protein EGQ26_05275, partial [Clostridiales bacterium]|nr:hypothetical protein [Clostridiales bacterium]